MQNKNRNIIESKLFQEHEENTDIILIHTAIKYICQCICTLYIPNISLKSIYIF